MIGSEIQEHLARIYILVLITIGILSLKRMGMIKSYFIDLLSIALFIILNVK